MSKSDAFETAFLKLTFQGVTMAGIADNTVTAPNTVLYVALHSADPGEAGTQATNELTYSNYARVAVARDSTGWTVTGNSVFPAANIDFPVCTGGSQTAAYYSIGLAASGAGTILYSGSVSPTLAISNGITPRITTASSITED